MLKVTQSHPSNAADSTLEVKKIRVKWILRKVKKKCYGQIKEKSLVMGKSLVIPNVKGVIV